MPPRIEGLHHVTATVNDAQSDLDFCAGTLSMRLVKQTVNFDNRGVYHFYYGDRLGTPGTVWTTFPYGDQGVRIGTKGVGQITATALSVPAHALEFWTERLRERQVAVTPAPSRFGDAVLSCSDPSGLTMELIATSDDTREPWTAGGVPPDAAVRGIHTVTFSLASFAPTIEFLRTMLGFRIVDEVPGRTRVGVGDRPGAMLDLLDASSGPRAINGLGTVHHVALAVASPEDQLQFRAALIERGVQVTDVLDRQYFQSIYFREPGGVLLEIATVKPGFDIDEPSDALGHSLKLPPWEEPNRSQIEANLPHISIP
jgi:glyoxalase family protein